MSMDTDLGIGTVINTPGLSSGLEGSVPSTSDGGFEFDLRRQRGSEYDFLMSRGILDWTTGSGMRTQMSSKCTAGLLSSSKTVDLGIVESVTDGE